MRLIIIFILFSNFCFAQNQNSIWCFGDSAGIDFSNRVMQPAATGGEKGNGDCGEMTAKF